MNEVQVAGARRVKVCHCQRPIGTLVRSVSCVASSWARGRRKKSPTALNPATCSGQGIMINSGLCQMINDHWQAGICTDLLALNVGGS
jgi:hypothetical protein